MTIFFQYALNLNCNSTTVQKIRQINVCQICIRLDQLTKTSSSKMKAICMFVIKKAPISTLVMKNFMYLVQNFQNSRHTLQGTISRGLI